MPHDMPLFLRRAVAEITYLGPEPDRWRSPTELALKNAQEPDHFIDLERVDWLDPLPPGRYEFYRRLYEKRAANPEHGDDYLPEHVGLQPYITMEVYGRLKAALREYRQLRATRTLRAAQSLPPGQGDRQQERRRQGAADADRRQAVQVAGPSAATAESAGEL